MTKENIRRVFMANLYIKVIFFCLTFYITLFDTFTRHKQDKWSISYRKKFKKIYILIWIILYLIYLFCIMITPSTRPFFIEHIFFGAFIHLVFAFFVWKVTMC